MLNAIEAYTEHRPEITSRAINLLFDIARIERCNQLLRALKVSLNPGGPSLLPIPSWPALDLVEACPSSPRPPHPQAHKQHYPRAPGLACPSTDLTPDLWPHLASAPHPALLFSGNRIRVS